MTRVNFHTDPHAAFAQVQAWWRELGTLEHAQRFGYVLAKASENPATQTHYDGSCCQRLLTNEWVLMLSEQSSPITQCICGQTIGTAQYLRHRTNGNVLQLGGDCLRKYTFNTELEDDIQTWLQYRQRNQRKNLQCLSCGRFRLAPTAPQFKQRCRSCYTHKCDLSAQLVGLHLGSDVARCLKCQHDFVRRPHEHWRTTCGRCWHRAQVPPNSPV